MTIVDNYFPFDTGPGSTATAARWRLMARVWQGSGVIANYLNNMNPTIVGSVVTIDTGAVWIDGYYGEIGSPKTVTVTGSQVVVARMDPVARQILLTSVTTLTQTLTGIYEVPIARVTSGAITDIRQFASGGGAVLPGLMMEHGGGAAPLGWLLCNGASYLRTDFPGLFAAIGTTWGAADSTHFSVPDIRGRVTLGAGGGTGLTNRVLAARGGEENHTLTNAENGYHNHGGNSTTESAYHQHSTTSSNYGVAVSLGSSVGLQPGAPNQATFALNQTTGNQNVLHVHGINAEGGSPHNNMQPFVVVTKVIKT